MLQLAACVVPVAVAAARGAAAIDRAAVVRRHTVTFAHEDGVDPSSTDFNALTVGNGDFGFSADLTGLQSLNNSYHVPDYPLYTLSNWGWHSPDPELLGAKQPMFQPDGTLNYVYVPRAPAAGGQHCPRWLARRTCARKQHWATRTFSSAAHMSTMMMAHLCFRIFKFETRVSARDGL